MSGREIYTLLSLLEAERDFPATAGTGPVLTHRGRLGPFGVAVFEKHPKIGESEYQWGKKKCIFFFLPTPSRMQLQKKKKQHIWFWGREGLGRHKKHKAARERGSPGGESPGGVRGGGSAALGLCTGKRQPAQQAAGAAAGSPAPCFPRNS